MTDTELQPGLLPPAVSGGLPVSIIQGDINEHQASLLADHGAPSTPQASADSTLHGLGHATEYYVVLAIQELRNLSSCPRDILLALGEITSSPLNILPSLSKFSHVGRDRLLTAIIVT
jgi:hypothetical protein